jgi:hypothetical protein
LPLKTALSFLLFVAAPTAFAGFDANDVTLGTPESRVRQVFPSAHCKPLEWQSRAADRRCDDARAVVAGAQARVTFYLRQDKVEAIDVRFDTKDIGGVVTFFKTRYGAPKTEVRESAASSPKGREVYKVLWEAKGERALLIAPMDSRRASLLVSRGNFEEEIYRVR